MPDIHVPKVHSTSIWKLLLEVLLISVGVFLGLMGEQWREARRDREMAHVALRNLRTELAANRQALTRVTRYHAAIQTSLSTYVDANVPKNRETFHTVGFNGLQNVDFEHTAWDLAVATGALTHIDPPLALSTSNAYTYQQNYDRIQAAMITSAFSPGAFGRDFDGFVQSLEIYFEGVVQDDPKLLRRYDDAISKLDAAIGDSH